MTAPTDAELVAHCLAGREVAWAELIDRHAAFVHSIGRRSGLDADDADDLVQDVFVLLWRHLPRLRDQERLVGWIAQTARRESWRRQRGTRARRARDQVVGLAAQREPAEPEDPLEAIEHRHLVRRAIDSIGERCRQLLDALFLRGLEGYDAVAIELDMPRGAIGPTRKRCLEKLLVALERLGYPLTEVDVSGGASNASKGLKAERRRASHDPS